MDQIIDWNHVYLLAWYDETGRGYLTTWDGDLPYVNVVVTGARPITMPLWAAEVPPGAGIMLVPPDRDTTREERLAFARESGGYLALGWYIAEGFSRPSSS